MNDGSHSQALWNKIRLAEEGLWAASERFWLHASLKELLPEFLISLHSVMQASIPLMGAARERALVLAADGDDVARRSAEYLERHIGEEQGHDEWLLRDLEEMGTARETVLRATPDSAVASLVGAQYFWALHAHPVAIFGYLAVLEGYPPLKTQLAEIQRRLQYPASAFQCLMAHAEDDPQHLAEINRTLDEMPLSSGQIKLVALSAFHTMDAVAEVLDNLSMSATKPECAHA
ncbi:MAG: iron-containing redox enzyme family protein [Acidobacteriaceae bacterium]